MPLASSTPCQWTVVASGNLWVTNNWKIDANPFQNPGGNAVVILIGAAAPLKTPQIGPPVPFR